jgi:hypothetical protein
MVLLSEVFIEVVVAPGLNVSGGAKSTSAPATEAP